MKYAKVALLLAIAMTPWLAQTRTVEEISGPPTEAQKIAETTKVVAAAMAKARIVEISNKADLSIVYFVLAAPATINLSQNGKHIKEFDNTYIKAFLDNRSAGLDVINFLKRVAEVYFCLNENGISTATAPAVYNFIKAAEGVIPNDEQTRLAMKMLLTVAAKNSGEPLHTALGEGTPQADIVKSLYRQYNIAFTE